MSSMRKALKILSFLAVIGAIDLAITAYVIATGGEGALEPLQIVTMALSVIFGLIIGVMGVGAANRPSKVRQMWLVMWLAVWANVGNVLLLVLNGEVIPSVIINCAIVCAFTYVSYQVKKEIGY